MGIIRLFPELNANWLIREIGSPLIDQKISPANQSERIRFLRGMFGKRQRNRNPETLLLKKEEEIEKKKRDARILPGIKENGRTSIPIRRSISTKRMYPLEVKIHYYLELKKIISIFVASKENRRDDKTKSHDSNWWWRRLNFVINDEVM